MVNDKMRNLSATQRLSMTTNSITSCLLKIAVCENKIKILESIFAEDDSMINFVKEDVTFFEQVKILSEGLKRGEKHFAFEFHTEVSNRWFLIKANYTDVLMDIKYPVFDLLLTDVTEAKHLTYDRLSQNVDNREIIESIGSAIARIKTDNGYEIIWANPSFIQQFGTIKFLRECIAEEDQKKFSYIINNDIACNTYSKKIRLRTEKHGIRWYDIRIVDKEDVKNREKFCIITDVTDEVLREQELKIFQKRYKMVLSVTSELVFEYDAKNDTMYYFRSGENSIRRPEKVEHYSDVLEHGTICGFSLTKEGRKALQEVKKNLYEKKVSLEEANLCFIKDGMESWIHGVGKCMYDDCGELELVIGKLSDVTNIKNNEEKLLIKAHTDALTKVSNREFAKNEINGYLIDSSIDALPSLLILDIDNFKSINDNYGHGAGDSVLIKISKILKHEFRKSDVIGRLGGDEFIVFLKDVISKDIVYEKAQRVCEEVNKIFKEVSVSIGVSIMSKDEATFDNLYKTADTALYQAKKRGKNTFVCYSELSDEIRKEALTKTDKVIMEQTTGGFSDVNSIGFFRKIMDNYNDIYYINLTKDSVKRYKESVLYQNEHNFRTYTEMYNHLLTEIVGLKERAQFEEQAKRENLIQLLATKERRVMRYLRLYNEKNEFIWCSIEILNHYSTSGEDVCCTLLFKYISDEEVDQLTSLESAKSDELEMELMKQEHFDPLTGLYKESKFLYEVANILRNDMERQYAIITFDVDRFRVFNDMYDEQLAEEILIAIADVLRALPVEGKCYCRYHSDRFILFIPYQKRTDIIKVIEFIQQECNKIRIVKSLLKLSFGVYQIVDRSVPVRLMCDWARLAEYNVKGLSMQYYAFYNEEYRSHLLEQQIIENEMHQALEEGQFEMYLQPSYELQTNKVIGAEALVRWKHPQWGMVRPDKFIPLFEKNGFVIKLDEFIWEEACKKLKEWLDCGYEIPISVNISRIHTYDTAFVQKLVTLVETYQIPKKLLQLEFTESMFTENTDPLCRLMERLKEQGFTLLMDDFGSGYSSLNMLKNVPIDVIKLDRVFFDDIMENTRGKIIIQSSIKMIHDLHLDVTAEGIEKKEHVEFLNQCRCEKGQGYFYSKPMPVKEFETLCFG